MFKIKDFYTNFILKIQGKDPRSLRARVIKGAAGSFTLQIFSVLLGLISSMILAKFIGAHGYGIYTYALAWINLLMVIAALGTNRLLTREVAIFLQKKQWPELAGLIRWSNLKVSSSSVLFAILLAGISFWFYIYSHSEKALALITASFLLPFMTLSSLRQSTLQGLHYVVTGLLPENILRPLFLILFFVLSHILLGENFTGVIALSNNVLACIITFVIGSFLLYKKLPDPVVSITPKYLKSDWLRSAIPFLLLSGIQAGNNQIGIIILGGFVDASDVGIYSVALKVSGLLSFFLLAFNTILAPNVASLYSTGDLNRLQILTTKSSWGILLLTLPLALLLVVFGGYILSIFGAEFVAGYDFLIILIIGQVFNAAMGSVGLLLTMTRHEKDALAGILAGFIINVALCLVLIPLYGALGAAISTTLNTFIWNLIFGILVFKRINIVPSILGRKKY